MIRSIASISTIIFLLQIGPPARAATLFPDHTVFSGGVDVVATLQQASRWSSISGLSDGIQVGVAPNFAENLGATTVSEIALLEGAVSAALAAWQTPQFVFDVTFDAAVIEGTSLGSEIDLFAVDSSHPVFVGNSFFGLAIVADQFVVNRPLTNGAVFDGYAIAGADVYVAIDRLLGFSQTFDLTPQQELDALQRLLMHEFGHGIGMGHPNVFPLRNFDRDTDPFNAMPIDLVDPFGDIIVSTNVDSDAIMSNSASFPALFLTDLRNDDLGGRDLLYPAPVPEPATAILSVLAAVAFVAYTQRPRRHAWPAGRRSVES
jgi:hypothetical protein